MPASCVPTTASAGAHSTPYSATCSRSSTRLCSSTVTRSESAAIRSAACRAGRHVSHPKVCVKKTSLTGEDRSETPLKVGGCAGRVHLRYAGIRPENVYLNRSSNACRALAAAGLGGRLAAGAADGGARPRSNGSRAPPSPAPRRRCNCCGRPSGTRASESAARTPASGSCRTTCTARSYGDRPRTWRTGCRSESTRTATRRSGRTSAPPERRACSPPAARADRSRAAGARHPSACARQYAPGAGGRRPGTLAGGISSTWSRGDFRLSTLPGRRLSRVLSTGTVIYNRQQTRCTCGFRESRADGCRQACTVRGT